MSCYARLLAHHPHVVIAAVTMVAGTCIIISLSTTRFPNFQDPQMGFEPRGTVLAQRETAWNNLMEETKPSGQLTTDPNDDQQRRMSGFKTHRPTPPARMYKSNATETSRMRSVLFGGNGGRGMSNVTRSDVGENLTVLLSEPPVQSNFPSEDDELREIMEMKEIGSDVDHDVFETIEHEHRLPASNVSGVDGFFCGDPLSNFAHVVFGSVDGREDLFTLRALQSMCALEESALRRKPADFEDLCQMDTRDRCCRSWSLGNYVSLLRNRTSCTAITEEDVTQVRQTLRRCSKYYYDLQLQSDCDERPCRGIPEECSRHNAVFHMIHFLMDTDYLNPSASGSEVRLKYAMVFLPIACSSAALSYFKDVEWRGGLADGITQIVAMDLGLKSVLFDEYLISDTMFIGFAGAAIFCLMWMFCGSLFVTFMSIVSIVFALSIAYFFYTTVFKITFFPFMNLLTSVIIIGIGADDAFIYCKVWACAKSEKNNGTLLKLVTDTFHSATLSMFVTSLTTAAAFYASYVSSITAIRCFSVFAGTTVLANFFLTVTWLPATVVMAEKWCSSNACICIPPFGLYAPQLQRHRLCSKACNTLWKLHYHFSDGARVFFEKILPCIVIKPRYVWVCLLGGLAACGVLAIFYSPGLHLPDSSEFQIFASDHPFEQYDLVFKDKFWFERVKKVDTLSKMPIRIVWGVRPVDNGDYLNPMDKGTVVFDDSFNLAAPSSQRWLLEFCRRLRKQPFYQLMWGPLLPNCFIETFMSWMDRRCVDTVSERDRSPCCERSRFPYSEAVFNVCIKRAMKALYATPALYLPGVAGPRFSRRTGRIAALVIEYDSKYSFTFSFAEMHEFVTRVESWVEQQLYTAPPGMRNGWFVSYFDTYDLQVSLARGTIVAIVVAIVVASIVLFATTLNVLITVFAIGTVACIIFVTVGSLALLGWKLNMLEAVTVSVAIGLAVDFTLHYGVVYKQCTENEDRETAVIFSITRVGSPIAMAAFTTFLAGLFMLPANVLGYIQIGKFVMIVMATSWIYSTLFFQSLLLLWGPQKLFGQFRYPRLNCCSSVTGTHLDKTVYSYTLSESTMSTSSIVVSPGQTGTNSNDGHELEPLTILGKFPDRLSLSSSGGGGGHRYLKHKLNASSSHSKVAGGSGGGPASRQRSGSLSVVGEVNPVAVNQSPRKVSLPTQVNIDPCPRQRAASSSTTVIF